MFGYDPNEPGVTKQNVEALIREFLDFESLQMNEATESWVAFWKYMHRSEQFWWNYYCHKDVKVSSQLRGQHPGPVFTEWCFTDDVETEARKTGLGNQS